MFRTTPIGIHPAHRLYALVPRMAAVLMCYTLGTSVAVAQYPGYSGGQGYTQPYGGGSYYPSQQRGTYGGGNGSGQSYGGGNGSGQSYGGNTSPMSQAQTGGPSTGGAPVRTNDGQRNIPSNSQPSQVPATQQGQTQNQTQAQGQDTGTSSTPAQSRNTLHDGDELHGRAVAVNGGTITIEGLTLALYGLASPPIDATCNGSGNTTWYCGQKAHELLAQILSPGSLSCSYVDGEVPTARCMLGMDDVSKRAVQEGTAISNLPDYLGAMMEARSDGRGIWANGSTFYMNPVRTSAHHRRTR